MMSASPIWHLVHRPMFLNRSQLSFAHFVEHWTPICNTKVDMDINQESATNPVPLCPCFGTGLFGGCERLRNVTSPPTQGHLHFALIIYISHHYLPTESEEAKFRRNSSPGISRLSSTGATPCVEFNNPCCRVEREVTPKISDDEVEFRMSNVELPRLFTVSTSARKG
jgi:hypothetical protein